MPVNTKEGQVEGIQDNDLKVMAADLEKSLKSKPKDKVAWNNLGFIYKRMGKLDKAIRCFDNALKLDSEYAETWNNKGDAFYKLGKLQEAINCFERAIDIQPRYEKAWYNKAVALEALGEDDESLDHIDMVLSINPAHESGKQLREIILGRRVRERRFWIFTGYSGSWEENKDTDASWGVDSRSPSLQHMKEIAEGDIIIAYRTAPENDIYAIFEATSWMYIDDTFSQRFRVGLRFLLQLPKPIPLETLKKDKKLKDWDFLTDPTQNLTGMTETIWEALNNDILTDNPTLIKQMEKIEGKAEPTHVVYHVDPVSIVNKVGVSAKTIHQIMSYLKSGKNVLIYGPSNSGQQKLANLLADHICGKVIDEKGKGRPNYTMRIADPEWRDKDVIGERSSLEGGGGVGFSLEAIDMCSKSLEVSQKPHYLLLHKLDRLDVNKSLGYFLSAMRQRRLDVMEDAEFVNIPRDFRVIATADVNDDEDLLRLMPLKGDFAFIELQNASKADEYENIPVLVQQRLIETGAKKRETVKNPDSMFDNDLDGSIQKSYDKLMRFVEEESPHLKKNAPRGVRTYLPINTSILVDCMVFVINASGGYSKDDAVQDAIISNILPHMRMHDRSQMMNIMLKAVDVFEMASQLVRRLDIMIAKISVSEHIQIETIAAPEREMERLPIKKKIGEMEEGIEWVDADEVNQIEPDYGIDTSAILSQLALSMNTNDQVVTNLQSGRNIILYGPPGCGKTKLSTLLSEQICSSSIDKSGKKHFNYTIITANAEWSNYEIVGGLAPKLDPITGNMIYEFKDGYVTTAVKKCLVSLKHTGKPHYLLIDEFNRANIDEAFGKLFTVFEYRDAQALLTPEENKGNALHVPRQFRIIGTMNVQDKNTLFDIGHALMRRYAFIEIGLPDKEDEFNRMPHFVDLHCEEMGISLGGKKTAKSMFKGDKEGRAEKEYRKLMKFLEWGKLPEEGIEMPIGVRTYRKIGTAQVIDCMIWTLKASGDYSKEEAMQDAIIANILPQLENLEKTHISNIYLKALKVFGERSLLAHTIDRMRKSTTSSIFG